MRTRLRDKIALVTGASRGVGRATALALAREGAQVVIAARTESELDELAREIESLGTQALAVTANVMQEADVARLAEAAFNRFGQVDILVNNVGVGKWGTLTELTIQDYDWMMDSNMRSTFLCTKACLPQMLERKQGWIVFVGSLSGLKGFPRQTAYAASKFAQVGFAQALDSEVHEHGIKVSVIASGGINTHFAFGTGRTPGEPRLEKFLNAEDVAEAVVFAVTQPEKSRTFLIEMLPMSQGL
jgi:3-oxoacyl-[acyl-carrier protein] reductase